MVNVLYDFNGLTPWFVPYLGVGAGYQWANENGVALTSFTGPSSLALQNTSKGSFAYQGIVGAAFPMPAIPGLAFTAEYRYMGLAGSLYLWCCRNGRRCVQIWQRQYEE